MIMDEQNHNRNTLHVNRVFCPFLLHSLLSSGTRGLVTLLQKTESLDVTFSMKLYVQLQKIGYSVRRQQLDDVE